MRSNRGQTDYLKPRALPTPERSYLAERVEML